jgi:LDH2 family malate/lactate/ureidoglycolate dehydrogenase
MFVNTHGAGKLVASWGGLERRLSANPIAIAIPRRSSPPILVDISTCANRLVEYVKSSKLAEGFAEILIPGEPERLERERRERDGVPVDEESWRQIRETAERYGVKVP